MLNLLRWLAAADHSPDRPEKARVVQAAWADVADETLRVIVEPKQIGPLLDELLARQVRLKLWGAGMSDWCQSCLTRVDSCSRSLTLTAAMQYLPKAGQTINLSFQQGGNVALGCLQVGHARETRIGSQVEIVTSWPDFLMLHDMRHSPRLHGDPRHPAWRQLLQFLGCPDSRVIRDIGEGGIGLYLGAAQGRLLADRSCFDLYEVVARSTKYAEIHLQRTYIVPLADGGHAVGASFVDMPAAWQRDLRKQLLKLQAASVIH